ncbi:putative cytosol aminopeptidase [bacterium AB1]|nr:putative cytosol aminopeptidase [bacterium AB1]
MNDKIIFRIAYSSLKKDSKDINFNLNKKNNQDYSYSLFINKEGTTYNIINFVKKQLLSSLDIFNNKKAYIIFEDISEHHIKTIYKYTNIYELHYYFYSTSKVEICFPQISKEKYNDVTQQTINESLVKSLLSKQSYYKQLGQYLHKYNDIVDDKASELNPEIYEKYIVNLCKEESPKANIEIIMCDEKSKFTAINAVGRGSHITPRLVFIKINGNNTDKYNVGFVGKGVTYDTGGLGLKPAEYMDTMHIDMGGSALALFSGLLYSKQNPTHNVIISLPIVENCVSGNSYKNGDTISTYKNKNIIVKHTDAEGRVILSDALEYTLENNVKNIFVMCTLTGAAKVVVSKDYCVMVSNNQKINKLAYQVAQETGEKVHILPNDYGFLSAILVKHRAKTYVRNTGKSYGGSCITAAMFIMYFAITNFLTDKDDVHQESKVRKAFFDNDVINYIHMDIANYFDSDICSDENDSSLNLLEYSIKLAQSLNE